MSAPVPSVLDAERSLALLHRVSNAMARALSMTQVVEAIFDNVVASLGGGSAGLWLLDEGEEGLGFAGGAGMPSSSADLFQRIPLDADLPGPLAVRSGEAVLYPSLAERNRRWPALAGVASDMEATAVLPLVARDRGIGCLSIGFSVARRFSPDELILFGAIAEQCALALDRAQLYDAQREANETLEFLADATAVMVSALEPEEVLRQLVRLAVPRLVGWCAVYVAEEDHLRRAAVAIEGYADDADPLPSTVRVPIDAHLPVARVYRSGEPERIAEVDDAMVARTYGTGRTASFIQAMGFRAGLCVPILVRGRPVGVMSVAFTAARSRPHAMAAVAGLAARAGVALDNAVRFEQERRRVEVLAKALLPADLPAIPGFQYATRYVPASDAVCGDWYDVMTLTDGAFMLGVGDAAGHGLEAASLMAELRNAARGLAAAGRLPPQLLTELGALLPDDAESFATALYARLDPASAELVWASAGHPPPLRVGASGANYLARAAAPPLGAGTTPPPLTTTALAGGELVILFSDGIVERRGEHLDVGLERLRKVAEDAARLDVEDAASYMIDSLCSGNEDDDCSLLVIRRDLASR